MTNNVSNAHLAADLIKKRLPSFQPTIGIVLGSGLGGFAEQLEDSISIDYSELPGFPEGGIHGHGGKLVLGYLSGKGI